MHILKEGLKDQAAWRRYMEYLKEIGDRLPPGARAFAFAPEHYDMVDRRCPHDSWVESVLITESVSEGKIDKRILNIQTKFLGAYHDGHFTITYSDVRYYEFSTKSWVYREGKRGHGDWLVDEIFLNDDNLVCHEILFSGKGIWKVICVDLQYGWAT